MASIRVLLGWFKGIIKLLSLVYFSPSNTISSEILLNLILWLFSISARWYTVELSFILPKTILSFDFGFNSI